MAVIYSAEVDQIFTALAEFQSKVGAIPKTATNPFFKSKYASLPDVVAVASPILTECGLCVTQLLGHDVEGDTLTTILGHKSGQMLGDTMRLRPVKSDPQAQGSATSYGRRYAYMAVLGLVADEDDDGNAAGKAPAPRSAPAGLGHGEKGSRAPRPKSPGEIKSPTTAIGMTEAGGSKVPVVTPKPSEAELAELRKVAKAAGAGWEQIGLHLAALDIDPAGADRECTSQSVTKAIFALTPEQYAALMARLGGESA